MFKFELNEKVKVKVTGYQGCIPIGSTRLMVLLQMHGNS